MRLFIAALLVAISYAQTDSEPILRCGNTGCGGSSGGAAVMPVVPVSGAIGCGGAAVGCGGAVVGSSGMSAGSGMMGAGMSGVQLVGGSSGLMGGGMSGGLMSGSGMMGSGMMGSGMMNGGMMNAAYQMEMQKEMMEHHADMAENMYGGEGLEFEGPDFEDGMFGYGMSGMGMSGMGMGMGAGYGMSSGMGMGAGMGMGRGYGMAQTVVPVTGVRYKLKPYTYKYEYPVWKPDQKMGFVATTYNNPCASGCNSQNPHCCHKEVTYVPKTVPKVVEETVSVPVEVDVPNVSCGCHASRPHCCGSRRPVSSRSGGCSCHASAPHCCRLSSPKWAYQRPSRNQHYGAVGYPFNY